MRTALTAALLFTAASVFAAQAPGPMPVIPRKSPALAIQTGGKRITLSEFSGKVCVIGFVSTECPHCQHLGTVFMSLQNEYGPKGVQFLMVAFNPEANVNLGTFTQTYARNFPVGISSDVTVLGYLQHPPRMHYFPNVVFVDRQGMIRAEHLGYPGYEPESFFEPAKEEANLRAEIDKLLKSPIKKK